MRIGIDAAGGDHAPDEIVKGAAATIDQLGDDDTILLVGDEPTLRELAQEFKLNDPRVEIHHAPDAIGMDESPVDAVREKPNSSLVELCRLGSSKKVNNPLDLIISAGNTGACVSAATMLMRRLPGIHRPGIACTIPTFHGPVVLCDVGANPEPRPAHLAQYAVMAETYARKVLHIEHPRIAQLNIGSEAAKGTSTIKQVRAMLHDIPDLNYTGYIEGRDLFERAADVVVTDGFVGNAMLKLAEGLASSLFKAITHEVFEADTDLALRLQPIMQDFIIRNDYHEYGGAPLLGVNGHCIICHGSSEARTIKAAVRVAREIVNAKVNDAIIERVAAIDEHAAEDDAALA
jgi:glycerol-3-phosphate acyltransferase PlsX